MVTTATRVAGDHPGSSPGDAISIDLRSDAARGCTRTVLKSLAVSPARRARALVRNQGRRRPNVTTVAVPVRSCSRRVSSVRRPLPCPLQGARHSRQMLDLPRRQDSRVRRLDAQNRHGVDTGMTLRLISKASWLKRRTRGDLYVEVHVEEHHFFQREGKHLTCEVPISYTQAVLGATLIYPASAKRLTTFIQELNLGDGSGSAAAECPTGSGSLPAT